MIWLIDLLIEYLRELRAASLISQILFFVFLLAPLISLIYWTWLANRKSRASVADFDAVNEKLGTARSEARKLQDDLKALIAKTPAAFEDAHARALRDLRPELAMELAQDFLDDQQAALILALRTRMKESIGHAVQDGAAGYAAAQSWAQAALALDPQDTELRVIIGELAAAEAMAAATGLKVKLKDDSKRKLREEDNARLPTDLEALTAALVKARDQGHYRLMAFLADHGLTISQRQPFGEGSQANLFFQLCCAEAQLFTGKPDDAFKQVGNLVSAFEAVFGEHDQQTLRTRHLLAQCQWDIGDAAGALKEVQALLPILTNSLGSQHQEVLTTRHLLAVCQRGSGDAAAALKEAQALLKIYAKVQEPQPHKALVTRILLGNCLVDLNYPDAKKFDTQSIRDGFIAAGLAPEHIVFGAIDQLEARIQAMD